VSIGCGLADNDPCTISTLEEVALILSFTGTSFGSLLGRVNMVSASTWTCILFLGLKTVCVDCACYSAHLYDISDDISSFDISCAFSPTATRAVISLQSFRKIWTGQLLERVNGYCECPTYSGLHSHHHRVHLPTRVPRRDPRIFNYQRSTVSHNWTTSVDRFVSVSSIIDPYPPLPFRPS